MFGRATITLGIGPHSSCSLNHYGYFVECALTLMMVWRQCRRQVEENSSIFSLSAVWIEMPQRSREFWGILWYEENGHDVIMTVIA